MEPILFLPPPLFLVCGWWLQQALYTDRSAADRRALASKAGVLALFACGLAAAVDHRARRGGHGLSWYAIVPVFLCVPATVGMLMNVWWPEEDPKDGPTWWQRHDRAVCVSLYGLTFWTCVLAAAGVGQGTTSGGPSKKEGKEDGGE